MSTEGVDGVSGDSPRSDTGLPKLALRPETDLLDQGLAVGLPPMSLQPLESGDAPEVGADEAHPTPEFESVVEADESAADHAVHQVTHEVVHQVVNEAVQQGDGDAVASPSRGFDPANGSPSVTDIGTPDHRGDADDIPVVETTGGEPGLIAVDHHPAPFVPEAMRNVVDLDQDAEAEKPMNWFLAADAFVTKPSAEPAGAESPDRKNAAKRTVKEGRSLPQAARPTGSSLPFAVLAIVVILLIGGFVKVGVLDGRSSETPPADLALRPGRLTCAVKAPAHSAFRYERRQFTEEVRHNTEVVATSRVRFVDNEAKSFIERSGDATFETEMMVSGRHFVASSPDVWTEVPLADAQMAAMFALPFAERFTEARWLNDTAVNGVATCVYSALLGRVTLPDGRRISNAQLELYVDSSGQYRRIRVRGVRLAEAPTGSASSETVDQSVETAVPADVETYVLTVDLEPASPFAPIVPALASANATAATSGS